MKPNPFQFTTALAAAAALSLGACKDGSKDGGADSGSGGDGGSGGSAPASESVSDQLVGVWAPNVEKMLEAAKAEMPADQFQAAEPMMKMMAEMMTLEIGKGTATMHSPEGPEEGTYTLADVDESAGTFSITVSKEGEEDMTGTGEIAGDTLSMTMDGDSLIMDRIDAATLQARIEKAKNFDPSSLFQGLGESLEGALNEGGASLEDALNEAAAGLQGALDDAAAEAGTTAPDITIPNIDIPDVDIPDAPTPTEEP